MKLPFTQHIKYLFICRFIFFVIFTLTKHYNEQYLTGLYDSLSGLNILCGLGSLYGRYKDIDGFNGLYSVIGMYGS